MRLFHLHAQNGLEIDLLLENMRGELVAIEVKSAATLSHNDSKGLRQFAAEQGAMLKAGLLLYTGTTIVHLGERLWAVPIPYLWGA